MRTMHVGMGVTGPLAMVNLPPCKMNFCRVYLRSRLRCILGPPARFWITDSCSGRGRVLKCFLLASSPLSANTFSKSCLEGNRRDFLTHSSQSPCEQVEVRVQKGDRWADWWIFCIGNPRHESGEITDCWGDQPSTCRHLGAERPHYHPHHQLVPLSHSGRLVRRVTRAAGRGKNTGTSESETFCLAPSVCLRRCRRLFSWTTCPACRHGSRLAVLAPIDPSLSFPLPDTPPQPSARPHSYVTNLACTY